MFNNYNNLKKEKNMLKTIAIEKNHNEFYKFSTMLKSVVIGKGERREHILNIQVKNGIACKTNGKVLLYFDTILDDGYYKAVSHTSKCIVFEKGEEVTYPNIDDIINQDYNIEESYKIDEIDINISKILYFAAFNKVCVNFRYLDIFFKSFNKKQIIDEFVKFRLGTDLIELEFRNIKFICMGINVE